MPGIEYNIMLPHGSVCLFKRLTVAREFAYMVGGAVLIYVDARRREQKKKLAKSRCARAAGSSPRLCAARVLDKASI